MKQRSRMELHVLQIDGAGAGSVRECQSIAAGAGWIRGVKIKATDAAGGEYGLLGEERDDGVVRLIESVDAETLRRAIDVEWLF
jgi:hypothetical protein